MATAGPDDATMDPDVRHLFVYGSLRPDNDTGSKYTRMFAGFIPETPGAVRMGTASDVVMVADTLYPSLLRVSDLSPEQLAFFVGHGAAMSAVGYVVGIPGDAEAFRELVTIADRIEGVNRSVPLYRRFVVNVTVRGEGVPYMAEDPAAPVTTVKCISYYRQDLLADLCRLYVVPKGDWMAREARPIMLVAVKDFLGPYQDDDFLLKLIDWVMNHPSRLTPVKMVHAVVNLVFEGATGDEPYDDAAAGAGAGGAGGDGGGDASGGTVACSGAVAGVVPAPEDASGQQHRDALVSTAGRGGSVAPGGTAAGAGVEAPAAAEPPQPPATLAAGVSESKTAVELTPEQAKAVSQWEAVVAGLITKLTKAENQVADQLAELQQSRDAASAAVRGDLDKVAAAKAKVIADFAERMEELKRQEEAALTGLCTQEAELQTMKTVLEKDAEDKMAALREHRDSTSGLGGHRHRLALAKETLRAIRHGEQEPVLPDDAEPDVGTTAGSRASMRWKLLRNNTKLARWRSDPALHVDATPVQHELHLMRRATSTGEISVVVSRSDVTTDFRDVLDSGEGADVTLVVGTERFPAHRGVLTARSGFFKLLLESTSEDEVVLSRSHVSRDSFKLLLSFYYQGNAKIQSLTQDQWNMLLDVAVSLEWEEATTLVFEKMEESLHSHADKVMEGAADTLTPVGWLAGAPSAGDDSDAWRRALTYSFELEGKCLSILNLYRKGSIAEDRWLAMSLHERFDAVGRNFIQLDTRIDSRAPIWMPKQVVYEDMGVLWEVNYSGDTVGFTPDLHHALHQLTHAVHSLGLAHGQRNDHIQMHISFPLMEPADAEFRHSVLALGVHLADYLFLHSFIMTDKLNEMWSSADVAALLGKASSTPEEFAEFVVRKSNIPNDSLKLKAVGLRGVDVYKVPNRYGFEIRKGYTLKELSGVMLCMRRVLSEIGSKPSSDVLVKLDDAPVDNTSEHYSVAALTEWVSGPARRVPYVQDKSGHAAHGDSNLSALPLDMEKVDAAAVPWQQRMVAEESHLAACKKVAFGRPPDEAALATGFVDRATLQLRQRIAFLLSTDWTRFPCSDVRLLAVLADEQAYLHSLLDTQVPLSNVTAAKALLAAHPASLDRPDVQSARRVLARQAHAGACFREAVEEFAARVATLY